MSEFSSNNTNNSQKQGTDIHYNKAGQAVNTETPTAAVKDQSQPTGKVEKGTSDDKDNKSSSSHHESHSSSGSKHAKLGGGKHSFVHPDNVEDAQDNEQKVKCDCGESVPVSQINQDDVNVAIKGQQSQNVDGSAGQTTIVYDESRPKGQQKASITVGEGNPATVIDNGIKSNENLYQHDAAVKAALGKNATVTKTVKVNSANETHINQANSNIPIDLEAGKHNPGSSRKNSKKD